MKYSSLNKRQVIPFLFKNPLILVALICVVTLLRSGLSVYGTPLHSLKQEEIDGVYSAWPGAYTLEFINQSDKRWFMVLLFSLGGISLLASDGTRVAAILLTPMIVLLSSPLNSSPVFQHINFKWWAVMNFVPPLNISNFNIFLPFHRILYVFDIAKFYAVTKF